MPVTNPVLGTMFLDIYYIPPRLVRIATIHAKSNDNDKKNPKFNISEKKLVTFVMTSDEMLKIDAHFFCTSSGGAS